MAAIRRLLAAVLVALAASAAFAHEETSSIKSEILVWISDAEGKLNQLAEATPADKYGWRPADGVRTTGEVFMHVAAANYGIPTFWGVAPPAGFKFETYEGSLKAKADIQKALKESFAHVKKALAAADDATLAKQIEFFGMKTTVRGAYLLVLSHAHEHLGQSITHARSNGIVPPWSQPRIEGHQH